VYKVHVLDITNVYYIVLMEKIDILSYLIMRH